jgi:MFS family permease
VYYGSVEGTERALVADFALPEQKGTAFGVYNAVAGVGALVASVLFGFIWTNFGAPVAFGFGAALAILAAALLFIVVPAPAANGER